MNYCGAEAFAGFPFFSGKEMVRRKSLYLFFLSFFFSFCFLRAAGALYTARLERSKSKKFNQ